MILGSGNIMLSHASVILSQPVPNSSQRRRRLMIAANFSLRERGGLSMILIISTKLEPGFVISTLFPKTSIVGPVPVMEKS